MIKRSAITQNVTERYCYNAKTLGADDFWSCLKYKKEIFLKIFFWLYMFQVLNIEFGKKTFEMSLLFCTQENWRSWKADTNKEK
jgi:hypothetical protein